MNRGRLWGLAPWLIGLLVLGVGATLIFEAGPLAGVRPSYYDRMRKTLRKRVLDDPEKDPVVIVGYDDASEQAFGLNTPRHILADVVRRAGDAGATVIILDEILSDPDVTSRNINAALEELSREFPPNSPKLREKSAELRARFDDDAALADAISRYPVIEAFANSPVASPPDAWKQLPESDRVDSEMLDTKGLPQCQNAKENMEKVLFDEDVLFRAAPMHASATVEHDFDGLFRRYPLFTRVAGSPYLYPTLGTRAASQYLEGTVPMVNCDPGGTLAWTMVGAQNLDATGGVVDGAGMMLLDFGGTFAESFKHYIPVKRALEKDATGKWVEPDSRFAGKMVFIGARADDVDKYVTPFDSNFSGIGFHATAARSLVLGEYLHYKDAYRIYQLLGMIVFWLAAVLLMTRFPIALAMLSLALPVAGHVATRAFITRGYMFDAFWPALFTTLAFFSTLALRFFDERRRAESTKKELGSFLSPEVVKIALRDPSMLAPARRDISILFSDIRGFTTTAEEMSPEALASLLEGYLTRMTQIVFDERGTLDKYIGDAVMALFGAPNPYDDHPVYACRAALAMMTVLAEMQKEWQAKGQPILDIGVGVSSGMVAVGRMGSRAQRQYTCLGDEVNFASRLEGLNKAYGTHILVGQSTRTRAGDRFVFRDLGLVQVKGKRKATHVYELLAEKSGADPAWLATWDAALAAFLRRDCDAAEKGFQDVMRARGDDNASMAFLGFIADFRVNPPAADWQGTIERHEK